MLLIAFGALCACAPSGQGLGIQERGEVEIPEDGLPGEAPPKPPTDHYGELSWEENHPQAFRWSDYLYSLIEKNGDRLVNGASDIKTFCPKYYQASRSEKIEFWGHLISEMAYFESRHQPTRRFAEPKKKDKITGKQLYSEGLMQMSYQDVMGNPECQFDWKADSKYAIDDPRRSILNPYKNLHCAFLVIRKQITRHDKIAIGQGAYWAVIKSSYERNKLPQIRAATQALEFCN